MTDRLPFTDRNTAKALNDALERIATLEAEKEANHTGWGKALETVAALTAALADDDTVDTRRLADRLDVWADTGQGGRLLAADTRIAAARLRELETDNERLRAQLDSLRAHVRPEMMRGIWAAPAGTATHDLGTNNDR
ncbi:MAG: hypothetical protein GY925_13170, partial [Actinomycetia bacterium]|nr:hypothetical protein [Actinomycetes bacterium]